MNSPFSCGDNLAFKHATNNPVSGHLFQRKRATNCVQAALYFTKSEMSYHCNVLFFSSISRSEADKSYKTVCSRFDMSMCRILTGPNESSEYMSLRALLMHIQLSPRVMELMEAKAGTKFAGHLNIFHV